MSQLTIIGLVTIIAVLVLLIKGKFIPPIVFIVIPTIAALIAGCSLSQISTFVKSGFTSVMVGTILAAFAIIYFSMMGELGMFDVLLNPILRLMGKSKNPVIAVTMATCAVMFVACLDGAGAGAILITVPLMLPFYDKLKIDKRSLLLIMSMPAGVMNMVPWTGPTLLSANVIQMDPVALWRHLIPTQIVLTLIVFVAAYFVGRMEIKKGAINNLTDLGVSLTVVDKPCGKSKKIFWINIALTIVIIGALVVGILNSAYVFMIGVALALIINYRGKKAQNKIMDLLAPPAMHMVVTVFSVGIFVGILQGAGFIDAIAKSLMQIIPASMGPHFHIIVSFLAMPLLMGLGTAAYYQGLLPLIVGISTQYGVAASAVACSMIIPANLSVGMSPLVPANYISLGLVGIEFGDMLKYSAKWIYPLSLIGILVGVLFGATVI